MREGARGLPGHALCPEQSCRAMAMRATLARQVLQNERDLLPAPSTPGEWEYRGWLDLALEISEHLTNRNIPIYS